MVEVRRGTLPRRRGTTRSRTEAEDGGGGGAPADIKSNNPHLTGGERLQMVTQKNLMMHMF